MSKVVKEKQERLRLAGMNQVPDRVPVTSQIETFAYGYAGVTIDEVKKNPFKGVNAFKKCYQDIYFDGYFEGIFVHPFTFFDKLGADSYFASADGYTAQHSEIAPMNEDEYAALIADPLSFLMNEINPRKFPNLNGTEEEVQKTILSALGGTMSFLAGMMGQGILLPMMTDTPTFFGGFLENPYDNIFDFLRGFKGSSMDLRRHKDEIGVAVDKIYEEYTINCEKFYSLLNVINQPANLVNNLASGFITGGEMKANPFPWFFNPCHAPAFMSPKQFGEYYWPTYKKSIELINSWGGIVCTLLEGQWGMEKLAYFEELAPGSVILYVDGDDIVEVKKRLGDKFAIMGGMPLNILRTCNKQQCLDYTKRVIDECAPGGGFIFTTDKSLLSLSDVNVDNMRAVNEFVHVYGQY